MVRDGAQFQKRSIEFSSGLAPCHRRASPRVLARDAPTRTPALRRTRVAGSGEEVRVRPATSGRLVVRPENLQSRWLTLCSLSKTLAGGGSSAASAGQAASPKIKPPINEAVMATRPGSTSQWTDPYGSAPPLARDCHWRWLQDPACRELGGRRPRQALRIAPPGPTSRATQARHARARSSRPGAPDPRAGHCRQRLSTSPRRSRAGP